MVNNIIIGADIWYFKYLNDDYYGRPISGISNLKRSKIKDYTIENIYHNREMTTFKLENDEVISDLKYQIFSNEDEAIQAYNHELLNQIKVCESHIDKINEMKNELEDKLIVRTAFGI